MTPQEADPELPICIQESLTEVWVEGTECSRACMGPFEGGRHYLHYLHHRLLLLLLSRFSHVRLCATP